MAKGNKKSKRTSRTSSGKRRMRRANAESNRVCAKIVRWERYQKEINEGKREGDVERWDTAGLKRRLSQLQGVVKMGVTTRV